MYSYESDILFGLLTALTASLPSMAFGIATYVLSAVAIYAISRRRGLRKPWLAWVPVLNIWLLGSLSDQYQYVVNRQNKSKRKWLLALGILMLVFAIVFLVMALATLDGAMRNFGNPHRLMSNVMGPAMAMMGLMLPLLAVVIAYYVIRYMALYDVFKSMDPQNCVLFLVLSILFQPTEAFFLFFNRSKDAGMPPRRQETVYEAEPVRESWEQENKDYL